jgi:hypothetical protein
MRSVITFAAVLSLGALAWGVQPATSVAKKKSAVKTPVKKAPVKSAAKTPAATTKTATVTHTAAAKKSVGKKVAVKRTTWRNRQATPSNDRYREIQNALVARGALQPEAATGSWDQASADALKKFQSEQNLDSNGKINSLSLIALGLGPRHDSPAPKTADGGNNDLPEPNPR